MGLTPGIVTALSRRGITEPTPIQAAAIPVVLEKKDIIGIAQTGTGKTLAFGLPLIQNLSANRTERALILAPTRELALQIEQGIRAISAMLPYTYKTVTLIGGVPAYRQIKDLQKQPRLIVATPGRLTDLAEQGAIDLSDIHYFVLDEADRMFDMGFAPQVNKIANMIKSAHQTMLFSATMSRDVVALAAAQQHDPVRVEVAPAGSSAATVKHELCFVHKEDKVTQLQKILQAEHRSILVFTRTKHGATRLCQQIGRMGYRAAEIHSNKSLSQRRYALDGFKTGQFRVLVATDVASRGIDVKDISLVVNFDLPEAAEDYVHRIGRTGRAGKDGLAISFATLDQSSKVKDIERLLRQDLILAPGSLPRPQHQHQPNNRPRSHYQQKNSWRRYK